MEPIQEILETVRAVRQSQLDATKAQESYRKKVSRFIRFGAVFWIMIMIAYVMWSWFVMSHTK